MKNIKSILSEKFDAAIHAVYGDAAGNPDPLIQVTGNPGFGDYQANLAMSLAKTVGDKPRNIATKLVEKLDLEGICTKVDIAGPGFINLYLADSFIDQQLVLLAHSADLGVETADKAMTVVVDYSAPNIAKEMHVGHLRSTVIGDAIVRVLMRQGHKVIRQNHMGDWGTQFGMLIEYLVESGWQEDNGTETISDLELRYRESKRKFDSDMNFSERARQRVVALQGGDAYTLALWEYLVKESIQHFMQIYQRLGVLLTESDNCPESFYNPRLDTVVASLEESGVLEISEGAAVIFLQGFRDRDDKPLPMIVRKSDGGYLYATTDLAAVQYRVSDLHADRLIYVTDARQAQHFSMLFMAVKLVGWVDATVRLDHVPFGTVLGADRKPFKTRDGGTIRLVDLLDEAETRSGKVLVAKNPDLSKQQVDELAKVISVGALKYADLSNDRIKDYVFDWDRMLALDGNTAPYLQNAYVRILSIFRKGKIQRDSVDPSTLKIRTPTEKTLALKIFQYAAAVDAVADKLEPHRLCTYLYELAASYHAFYEACPILKAETSEDERNSRLALCDLTARILKDGLGLLGIETVEKM